jgi:hypothetical protein
MCGCCVPNFGNGLIRNTAEFHWRRESKTTPITFLPFISFENTYSPSDGSNSSISFPSLAQCFPAFLCLQDHSIVTLDDGRIITSHGPADYLPIFDLLASTTPHGDLRISYPLYAPTATNVDEMMTYNDLNLTDTNGLIFPQAISLVESSFSHLTHLISSRRLLMAP